MTVGQITPESVREAILTANRPPSTLDLADHFKVVPTSATLRRALERLVAERRAVSTGIAPWLEKRWVAR